MEPRAFGHPNADVGVAQDLASLIRSAVQTSIGDHNQIGILFSGGVDSTCLAIIARKYTDVTLYICGTPDSQDMTWGREVAYTLDMPTVEVGVTKEKVLASLEDLVKNHGLNTPRWTTTFICFNMIAPVVEEPLIMSGQGADELFGGYRKYTEVAPGEAKIMMLADLEELRDDETPLYRRIAESHGKRLSVPFLEPNVIDYGVQLPLTMKLAGNRNKAVLRDAARALGVTETVAERPKKAMQYGSGVSKILKDYIKEVGKDLSDVMEQLSG